MSLATNKFLLVSASLFALPTYVFVGSMFVMIVTILVKLASGSPHAASPPPVHVTESLGVLLVLKAFSSGCASLTGVEAMSNSVSAFKPVEWRNARTTLTTMAFLDGGMLLGVSITAHLLNLRWRRRGARHAGVLFDSADLPDLPRQRQGDS